LDLDRGRGSSGERFKRREGCDIGFLPQFRIQQACSSCSLSARLQGTTWRRWQKDNRRVSRWGNDFQIAWEYLDYRGDYWHKLQTLKAFQAALAANRVLHVSPRAYLEGKDETAVKFFGRTYFLDPRWFRILQICRAPVLPCFAVADTEGRIRITIHPALPTDIRQMAAQFARLQSDYLTKFPELGRFWKAVYLNRSQW
jgi:hypothetical protein